MTQPSKRARGEKEHRAAVEAAEQIVWLVGEIVKSSVDGAVPELSADDEFCLRAAIHRYGVRCHDFFCQQLKEMAKIVPELGEPPAFETDPAYPSTGAVGSVEGAVAEEMNLPGRGERL